MQRLLISSFFLLFMPAAQALTVDEPLPRQDQENIAREIFQQVRCVICQGQSIADSSAEIAIDMRREIRGQVKAGRTSEEILGYLSQRYGDSIRMQPEYSSNKTLWWAPLGFLLAGMAIALTCCKRRQR